MHRTLAAIDVGSNAIRMIIAREHESGVISVIKKLREPVRLGGDVFKTGFVSEQSQRKTIKAFKKFKKALTQNKVDSLICVATSAMREAANASSLRDRIFRESQITVDIIDGNSEGQIIFEAINHALNLRNKRCLLIDIGGGSVEFTFTRATKKTKSKSFPLGTVRMLEALHKESLHEKHLEWMLKKKMHLCSRFLTTTAKLNYAIGTGGNFECLAELKRQILQTEPIHTITTSELEKIIDVLKSESVRTRATKYKLRPDRADVILPAAYIALLAMKQSRVEKLAIPFVGLRDGLLLRQKKIKTGSLR